MNNNDILQILYNRNRKEIKSSAKKLKEIINKPFPQIQKEVQHFMRGYVDIVTTYNIESLYRGRKWSSKEPCPTHIDELLCPPINKIEKYGRINTPKEQVLYLSETPQTIYYEIRAKEGDEIILLRITPKEKKIPFRVSSFVRNNIGYNPLSLNTVMAETLDLVGNEFNLKKVIEIRNQVADILQKEVTLYNEAYYKLTSSFSKSIFREHIDGVIYPSIQTKKIFFNIATRPRIMDTHYSGHTVVRVKLKSLSLLSHNVDVIRNGFVKDDGTLIWDDSTEFEFPS